VNVKKGASDSLEMTFALYVPLFPSPSCFPSFDRLWRLMWRMQGVLTHRRVAETLLPSSALPRSKGSSPPVRGGSSNSLLGNGEMCWRKSKSFSDYTYSVRPPFLHLPLRLHADQWLGIALPHRRPRATEGQACPACTLEDAQLAGAQEGRSFDPSRTSLCVPFLSSAWPYA
jgi:hypothetical protein